MVTLVDTSVWIDHFRGVDSVATRQFRKLVGTKPEQVATTQPIVMELLSGPTDPFTVRRIEDQLGSLEWLDVEVENDFHQAAALARLVRQKGNTVRSIVDCLIAAVAIRTNTELWHKDEDFARIAEVVELRHRDLR